MKRNTILPCLALLAMLGLTGPGASAGSWTPLANAAPGAVNLMLLLSDGTVMAAGNDGNTLSNVWYRLTPDPHGSYANGTWETLAPMNYTRLYYSSAVLTNGMVLVAGGEYGTGTTNSELYDPLNNTWTVVPLPSGLITTNNSPNRTTGQNSAGFMDSISKILPDGDVLVAPVEPVTSGGTVLYHAASNTWAAGPGLFRGFDQDEASWVKLPDDSILTIDPYGTKSERYIPSLNRWVNDANVPVALYSTPGELGAGFLLPNGRALYLGGNGKTALYTPSGTTNAGSWAAGPVMPSGRGIQDAPAAMMVNGKILCTFGTTSNFNPPTYFYEYDPVANSFAQVNGPTSVTDAVPSFAAAMLDLPDGTVLYSHMWNDLYVYQPIGSPLPAGQPVINSVSSNDDGSFTLTGTLLNGISEGAAYGDDEQMNSNYPLVRLTDSDGNVYYARTYGWNSTSVMASNRVVSTQFTLPAGLPAGSYSLVVSANGNSSAAVSFSNPFTALSILPATGFFSSGFVGGPFSITNQNLTLTNTGSASLGWSLANTSSWLNLSLGSDTLTPGGPAANISASLTAAAYALPLGNYTNTVWFTNLDDGIVQSRQFTLAVQFPQLVLNGGFETGQFTDWNESGNFSGNGVVSSSPFVHFGAYGARFGPATTPGFISQTLPTTAGQLYLLSVWLNSPDGLTPNEFLVSWKGNTLLDQVNIGPIGWTNVQYLVTATSASTVLEFGFRDDPTYLGLDDSSVIPVPEPAFRTVSQTGSSVTLAWSTLPGVVYQVQYSTNLAQSNWTVLGSPLTATNVTASVSDPIGSSRQRFYRLLVLP